MNRTIEELLQEMELQNKHRVNPYMIGISPCVWPELNKKFLCGNRPDKKDDYDTFEYGATVDAAVRNYYDSGKYMYDVTEDE